MNEINTSSREIVMSRLLNAPRELVFEVWTKPEHIVRWWGPDGFTTTIHEIDVKPGGVWRFIMHGPDGTDYPNKIVYKLVQRPERLEYSHCSDDEENTINFEVTVTFDAQQDKTLVTMRSIFPSEEALKLVVREYGAVEGAKQHLGRLETYLLKNCI